MSKRFNKVTYNFKRTSAFFVPAQLESKSLVKNSSTGQPTVPCPLRYQVHAASWHADPHTTICPPQKVPSDSYPPPTAASWAI